MTTTTMALAPRQTELQLVGRLGSLDHYIQAAAAIPVLTAEEEYALATRLRDENDLEALRDGDQESGSLSTSDVELDVEGDIFYYDVYAFSLEQESDLRVTVNPSNDLNVNFEAWSLEDMEGDFNDAGGPGDTETVEYEAVPEGCYLLFVSSFDPEETGSYTVEIEEL